MQSSRIFSCARCHCQVVICCRCDRGQVYCPPCAPQARTDSLRRANRKYRTSHKGRLANALRQRRFRYAAKQACRKKVTHQGSDVVAADGSLFVQPNTLQQKDTGAQQDARQCHFCQCAVSPFLRRGFLRREKGNRSATRRRPWKGSG